MHRTTILFVLPFFPFPVESGGHMALLNGIIAIKDDLDVTLAFPVDDREKYERAKNSFLKIVPNACLIPLFNEKHIITIPDPEYPVWYRMLSRFKVFIRKKIKKSGSEPIIYEHHPEIQMCLGWISSVSPLGKAWLEHIAKICSEYHFDIIQVEIPWLFSQILTLPEGPSKICVHHEVGFVRRELEQIQYPYSEYIKACKAYTDIMEIGLLNKYDAVITLSIIDRQKLKDHGVKVPVFSSFATVNTPPKSLPETIDGKHLVFVGPEGHTPNFIGITWFLENCWASLLSKDRNYRLSIIGNWSKEYIAEYTSKYPNINFLGYVNNLVDTIRGTVMIIPITVGSGIRMKILDACSIGVPFVSTTIGAEGIPVVDGETCYIADTPDLFVKKILKLQDSAIQKIFIKNAYDMIVDNYSIDALRKNRLAIYKEILRQN